MQDNRDEQSRKENEELSTGNIDFAKKWGIVCLVLLVLLVILGIVLYFCRSGDDLWSIYSSPSI